MPLLILAAILGSLCIILLATGLCKAALLLKTSVLPDVIPRTGFQACHCALRRVAGNPAARGIPCVIKFEENHTEPVSRNAGPLTPKLERQGEPPTLDSSLTTSSNAPGTDGAIAKIEFLSSNKEVVRSFH